MNIIYIYLAVCPLFMSFVAKNTWSTASPFTRFGGPHGQHLVVPRSHAALRGVSELLHRSGGRNLSAGEIWFEPPGIKDLGVKLSTLKE